MNELVVVGAGPAGLSAAAAAREQGWEPLVLERAAEVGGLWARVPADLRCLSPRRRDRLPDGAVPLGPGPRARADEVLAAWRRYAGRARFELHTGVQVQRLDGRPGAWVLQTSGGEVRARRVIAATGEYGRPWIPPLPGSFDGEQLHSSAFRPGGGPTLLVGSGNSAVDLARRIQGPFVVATRRPLGSPPNPRHTTLRWWLSGLPARWLPPPVRCSPSTGAVDPWLHEAVGSGRARRAGEVLALRPGGALTSTGFVPCARIVWATGFRRELGWLQRPSDERDTPRHDRGLLGTGLAVVGLPCQRTRRSGFLRGLVSDAREVARRLR